MHSIRKQARVSLEGDSARHWHEGLPGSRIAAAIGKVAMVSSEFNWLDSFKTGAAIPAHPLALTAKRELDERRQRALTRYYLAAGAGGVAVGVHTTQFQIRDPKIGLYEPVLALAAEELLRRDVIRIAGVCGKTAQAIREATIARRSSL